MKRKLVWCLFFFCLIGCTGCISVGEQERGTNGFEKVETLGEIENNTSNVVVLISGNEILTRVGTFICEKMGSVYYQLSNNWKEEQYQTVENADYILIGTDKELLELEFSIRNCLEERDLQGKKVALFFIDQKEEKESLEQKFLEWYPNVVLLPSFTMDSDSNFFEEEMGRINGWLTTVMTYDMVTE